MTNAKGIVNLLKGHNLRNGQSKKFPDADDAAADDSRDGLSQVT